MFCDATDYEPPSSTSSTQERWHCLCCDSASTIIITPVCQAPFLFLVAVFTEEPQSVIQLVRCREELDCHDTMFAVLTRLHLDMEAHKIKDASVHLLHLTWQRDLYPWARVKSHEHVADISDICPCPLHAKPALVAEAKTKAAAKPKANRPNRYYDYYYRLVLLLLL